MSKFDAATAVEAMEFDFTAFGGGSGVITEPSQGALETFFKDMSNLQKQFAPVFAQAQTLSKSDMTDDEKSAAIEGLNLDGQLTAMNVAIGDAIERLTDGSVKSVDIANLPFRIQQAFVDWISSELRPEKKAPGTSN